MRLWMRVIGLRKGLFPSPGCTEHVLQRILGCPAQLFTGFGVVCINRHHITRSALAKGIGQGCSAYLFECLNHFKYRLSDATAQIKNIERWGICMFSQMPDCSDMRLSHVAYMQVVAHAGSVAGWVVATINGESFAYAGRRLGDVGQEVFRNASTKLTNQCRGVCPPPD